MTNDLICILANLTQLGLLDDCAGGLEGVQLLD